MAIFKNEKGESKMFWKDEVGSKRTIVIDGVTWKRQPTPKPPTRAERLSREINNFAAIQSSYQELADTLTSEEYGEKFTEAQITAFNEIVQGLDTDLDSSEVESLKDEIESWKSNLEGTNLEYSSKYQDLSDVVDSLDNAIDSMSSINFDAAHEIAFEDEAIPEDISSELATIADAIGDIISQLEDVSFPGMY